MATSPDFAPLEFEDISSGTAEYAGADIELGRYIAEQLGVELKIEAMDFNSVQAAMSTGSADIAISGFAYTEDRAESMELSDYFNKDEDDGQGLLVMKETADSFQEAADFDGKTVAAQNGALQYNLVQDQLPGAKIEPISGLNDAIMMLKTGKVDAVAVSGDNGKMFAENYDDIVMSEFYFDYSAEGNVLAVPKGETELMDAINEILADVNEQGLYSQWLADAKELAASLGLEMDE